MQHDGIGLGQCQLLCGENVAVLQALIDRKVREALALYARHIQNIQLGQACLKVGRFDIGHLVLFNDIVLHIAGHAQLIGRNQHQLDARVAREGGDERVDGAAVFQVTAKAHGQVVQSTLFAANGQKVGQRLGGVCVAAVTCVDNGNGGVAGGNQRRALVRVTHGDDVGIAADDLGGIGNALALGGRGAFRLGEADDVTAQLVHSRLKGKTGTG